MRSAPTLMSTARQKMSFSWVEISETVFLLVRTHIPADVDTYTLLVYDIQTEKAQVLPRSGAAYVERPVYKSGIRAETREDA